MEIVTIYIAFTVYGKSHPVGVSDARNENQQIHNVIISLFHSFQVSDSQKRPWTPYFPYLERDRTTGG